VWAAGIGAGVLGAGLLLWLLFHAGRSLVDQPRVPRSRATYGFYTMLCVVLLAGAGVSFGLQRLMRDHARLDGKTRMAEVRCERAGAGKVRLTYAAANAPAARASVESAGSSCELAADLVTMRSFMRRLGMGNLVRVTRLGGEARPPENPGWLTPDVRSPSALPLRLLVHDAREATVSLPPDDKAVFHLVASPEGGLALEKSGG
jgi:hypothetical protein